MGARWRKEEVAEIALDVLALIADFDPFAARANEILQSGVKIDRVAHLVEISHL